MSNIYYVYAYLRNTDSKTAKAGTPYYIGMGSKNRAFSKHHNSIPLPKNKKHIVILENNLTQIGAYSLERRYLKWYGRKDLKTGILINRSGGGPGINQVSKITKKIMSDNAKRRPRRKTSEETKKKISESMMGKNLGKKRTEEEKAKLKNRIPWNKGLKGVTVPWNKGLKGAYSQSEEANRKRSATMKGRPKVIGSGRKKKVNS